MEYTQQDFVKGQNVNVERRDGDMFNHNFTGHVIGYNAEYVIVEDGDGDCWDCEPSQLSFSSDDVMND